MRGGIKMTRFEAECFDWCKSVDAFHWTDLTRETGAQRNTAQGFIRRWEGAGLIRCVRREVNKRFFILAEKTVQPPEAVQPARSAEGNMWRSMRLLGQFTPTDIAAHSTAGGIDVTVPQAERYCRLLCKEGYLKALQRAQPGKRSAVYKLLRNTGPKTPRARRVSGLWDPNTGEFMPHLSEGGA